MTWASRANQQTYWILHTLLLVLWQRVSLPWYHDGQCGQSKKKLKVRLQDFNIYLVSIQGCFSSCGSTVQWRNTGVSSHNPQFCLSEPVVQSRPMKAAFPTDQILNIIPWWGSYTPYPNRYQHKNSCTNYLNSISSPRSVTHHKFHTLWHSWRFFHCEPESSWWSEINATHSFRENVGCITCTVIQYVLDWVLIPSPSPLLLTKLIYWLIWYFVFIYKVPLSLN